MKDHSLQDIKAQLHKYKGCEIYLHTRGGRKKSMHTIGILDGLYPDIFTIRVESEEGYVQRFSYTYSEILTQNVMILPKDKAQ